MKIDDLIKKSAARFSQSLKSFSPAHGKNGYNESNILLYLSNEFLSKPDSIAFYQFPYLNSKNKKYNLRIDCYLGSSNTGILIEAKRLYSIEKAKEILNDFNRMGSKEVMESIKKCSLENSLPQEIYSLVVAEVWTEKIVNWWEGITPSPFPDWDAFSIRQECNCRWGHVPIESTKQKLFWCYGYRKIEID